MLISRPRWLAVGWLLLAATPATAPAAASREAPTLHEPIAPDPREDLELSLVLDGNLPAAIRTPRGLVSAPDPTRPVGSGDAPYGSTPKGDTPGSTFRPDRDTRRPDTLPYDDPFSPSTAPFKRLSAYDTVDANYTLSVKNSHATSLPISPMPRPDASEEPFFADMVVDLSAGEKVRIPSVGPGARVLRARAGLGSEDAKFTLYEDGAENWFIQGETTVRARLVMELSVPRAAFGGDFGNPTRAELGSVPPLPPNVKTAASEVAGRIGVTPRSSPREVVNKLVSYFRNFEDSEEPPTGRRDIYLDLALSQKGVCRHRSFAFFVTALYLGIPTRMISNEAHAWVEVYDGRRWRRIDLGGAGRTLHNPLSTTARYEPPPDSFAWPDGASRGDDLGARSRRTAEASNRGAQTAGSAARADPSLASGTATTGAAHGVDPNGTPMNDPTARSGSGGSSTSLVPVTSPGPDERPSSTLTMTLGGTNVHRSAPLAVRGRVTSNGEGCGHVAVEILLRSRAHEDLPVGFLATDDSGTYDGTLVVPVGVPLGEYEAHARTLGDARCGRGQTK